MAALPSAHSRPCLRSTGLHAAMASVTSGATRLPPSAEVARA